MEPTVDVLTLTASVARQLLDNKIITSVQLVKAYLTQIEAHNHNGMNLNAFISVAPEQDLLERAHVLDQERQRGLRSELHGIPFIAKDVFVTHPDLGMSTTAGNPCFATAMAKRTAPMIQHLLDAGMILLGKTNLTEFCGLKEPMNTTGRY